MLALLKHLGGPGLLVVGILDNSLLPTAGSEDFLTILLAAQRRELWLYYAAMATLGAVVGGYLTYRLGSKGGEQMLDERLPAKRVRKVSRLFERWGFSAVFVPALLPPPAPTVAFILVAGALHYPLKKFLIALTAGRALRYTALAYLASVLGRQAWRLIVGNTFLVFGVAVAVAIAVAFALLFQRRLGRA